MQPAVGGGAVSSGSIRPPFAGQSQLQTYWCWAAVSASVADFYGGNSWTQCSIAGAELNLACCGDPTAAAPCNKPYYLQRALTRVGHLANWTSGNVDISTLKQEIGGSRPLCCRIEWANSGGDGHFVTLTGWSIDDTGIEYVDVEDPFSGFVQLPKKKFESGYYNSGDQWTHSYFTS